MPVFQSVAPIISNDVHQRYVLNILEKIKLIPDIEVPKFVFAHILIPHPPFIFDADGSSINRMRNLLLLRVCRAKKNVMVILRISDFLTNSCG